jgi:hypothetical protein
MSRNYLQSWEFREQVARDLEQDERRRAAAREQREHSSPLPTERDKSRDDQP